MERVDELCAAVDKLSIKELKAELDKYGVDYSACVEKKDLVKLLTKTREERGSRKSCHDKSNFFFSNFPFFFFFLPAPASSSEGGGKSASTGSNSSASGSGGGNASRASSTGSEKSASSNGANASARVNPAGQSVPKKLRVAVVFDPDNDDVRDCSRFIQPFFMHTPEAEGRDIRIAWILPAALRDDLIRFNLPEQLSNFGWFQAIFVERDGHATGFDGAPIKGLDAEPPAPAVPLTPDNAYAQIATRWRADWLCVRRAGGVLGRMWLSTFVGALKLGFRSAYSPGMLVLDWAWHSKFAVDAAKDGPLVPRALDPPGAWYYWLLEVYPPQLVYKLDDADERDSDADKVMLACDDQFIAETRARLAQA